ncbi:MAG: FG-GAP repeat domain-containing protein, partial [Actinomycetota bacterium]
IDVDVRMYMNPALGTHFAAAAVVSYGRLDAPPDTAFNPFQDARFRFRYRGPGRTAGPTIDVRDLKSGRVEAHVSGAPLVRAPQVLIDSESHPGFDNPDTGQVYDIDGGGVLDIVSGHLPVSPATNGLSWFDGSDDWAQYPIGPGAATYGGGNLEGIAVGDVDGDGKPEVIACEQTADRVHIWKPGADPKAAWSGATLLTDFVFGHDVAMIDIDGDGKPNPVIAAEGEGAGQGFVKWGKLTPAGDPLSPADWTWHTICALEGAWAICDETADFSGSGRGDLLVGARSHSRPPGGTGPNPAATPGVYWLAKPVDPTQLWTKNTIESRDADWNHVDHGNFFGDGNSLDVIAHDKDNIYGPVIYRSSQAWAVTELPNPDGRQDPTPDNLAANPAGAVDTSGWTNTGLTTFERVAILPGGGPAGGSSTGFHAVGDGSNDRVHDLIAVERGRRYHMEAQVHLDSATAAIDLQLRDAADVNLASSPDHTTQDVWTELSFSREVLEDADGDYRFCVRQVGGGATDFYFTDVRIEDWGFEGLRVKRWSPSVPRVVATATFSDSADATAHDAALPTPAGGIKEDDLLIAVAAFVGDPTIGWPEGWTE